MYTSKHSFHDTPTQRQLNSFLARIRYLYLFLRSSLEYNKVHFNNFIVEIFLYPVESFSNPFLSALL